MQHVAHRASDEIAAMHDVIGRLVQALVWIDGTDPETVAAAEQKFGFNLLDVGEKYGNSTGQGSVRQSTEDGEKERVD